MGKSSLALRFVKDQYNEFHESTIGAAFLTQSVLLDETTVKFEIWDTAGQERYHSLAPMYYRGAHAAMVVYDVSVKVRGDGCTNVETDITETNAPHVKLWTVGRMHRKRL